MGYSAFVVVHKEMGIYLGNVLGLAFWSLLQNDFCDTASVFYTEEEAWAFIDGIEGAHPDILNYRIEPVKTAAYDHATIAELDAAGLEAETEFMKRVAA